jgi:hypothetical protein
VWGGGGGGGGGGPPPPPPPPGGDFFYLTYTKFEKCIRQIKNRGPVQFLV